MKHNLELSTDGLVILNNVLREVYPIKGNTAFSNVLLSIARDVSDKTESKTRTIIKKTSLFSDNKKHKLTLKHHEAWAVELILSYQLPHINNDYQKLLLKKIADTLNQKMA